MHLPEEDERNALAALLLSHPEHGERALTVRQCLTHPLIADAIKRRYRAVMRERYPQAFSDWSRRSPSAWND